MALILLLSPVCYAQENNMAKNMAETLKSAPVIAIEKPYLQFDKPYYALGDTIWFKVYLLNNYLAPSDKSQIINIDIANDSNKVVKQYKLPVVSGVTWGNISLDEKEFSTGTYTIRAYTNWMRNFGGDYFFYKTVYVSASNESNLLVNTLFGTAMVNGVNVLSAKLLFSDIKQIPFAVQPVQLSVLNGGKCLYKQKLRTGVDGVLDVNFNIPEKLSDLAIVVENENKDKRAVIPVNLNRPENADVQFLPEGGSLVAGLPAHVGFKAVGEDGKAIDISGIIIDGNQNQVAVFKSLHNGMGCFDMAVEAGQSYTAKVNLPGGLVKTYPLPIAKNTGMVLKVQNPMERDSLSVSVFAGNDLAQSGSSYFLVGKARGIVCYAAIINFNNVNFAKRRIAKSLFPTGIAHFSLLTTRYQPLNERLVFIDHQDNLDIKISTNKPEYTSRDSVALNVKVMDRDGKPVSGNFSLGVTDDQQVKTDSIAAENLVTRMLLTSDLKGYVEAPGYYLTSKTPEAWQALDNLLLTQGWVGYDWAHVFNPPAITYQPEKEFEVTGHVANVFNKLVKGTDVLLFSKTPTILMDTLTDQNGRFVFDRFPRVDKPIFVIRAVNKHGKSFNIDIKVDEVQPPEFKKPASPILAPWNVNSDSTLLNYAKNNALKKQQENVPLGGRILKEVKITGRKTVKGSQNINGPGNADQVLDEKDLEAAGKKTWLQLLQQNVKSFRECAIIVKGNSSTPQKDPFFQRDPDLFSFITDGQGDDVPSKMKEWYSINGKPVKFIIDGISLYQIFKPSGTAFQDVTAYLNAHSAEDIKGIEINASSKYSMRYIPAEWAYSISSTDVAFVEITTRSGNGPVIANTPGMYLYKPLPISWPQQFYKPRYSMRDTASHQADYRSTIDWEPNIVTDANGDVKIWFYTADKPSTYTITMEGTDVNGHFGYKRQKLVVGKHDTGTK